MTSFTEKNTNLFINDNKLFDDVINIISGTHPKIPIPKNFSLTGLFNLYIFLSKTFTDPIEAYFIWKRAVAWQMSKTFGYIKKTDLIISEFDPLLSDGPKPEEENSIDKVLSKFSYDYRWIFSQGHNIQDNLSIIKRFTQDDQILKEFLAFFPDYPIIKKFKRSKYWRGDILRLYKDLRNFVKIYLKSIVSFKNHPLMRESSIKASLTDPILFLWLNQNNTDNDSRLSPRAIRQIIAYGEKTYKDDVKLFIAWYWAFAKDKVINKTRIRESKSNDLPTVQDNIERNDKKILNKNLILKIYEESIEGKALPTPEIRKRITGHKENVDDFKKSWDNMQKSWDNFGAEASYEVKRINNEVKKNEYYIYKKPYDKLTTYTRYSKKILDVTIRPPVPWSKVKSSIKQVIPLGS